VDSKHRHDAKAAYRRPDILLYINGLPLVFIELKNSSVKLCAAYDDNLSNYKADIPQLFLSNAFCVFSNGIETRLGSLSAEWEHFFHWLRPEDEKEKIRRDQIRDQGSSVERFLQGLCAKAKLLDYVENFVIYHKGSQKIIAQNHQFLGVNRHSRYSCARANHSVMKPMQPSPLTPLPEGEGEKSGSHITVGGIRLPGWWRGRGSLDRRIHLDSDFAELLAFAAALKEEEERHIRLGLSEDELEIYDLLRKENLSKADEKKVRLAAKALLQRLTEEKPRVLVQDWYKDSQTRLAVRDEVGSVLDAFLPEDSYDKDLFIEKRDRVFELTLDLAINHQR
jgi:type I site-specific restriction-modification system R (restriction) subunit